MHHTIKPYELRAQRDEIFATWWAEQECEAGPLTSDLFKAIAEPAFRTGFFHGLCIGCEQGAKLISAEIANEIAERLGVELPE